VFLGRAPEVTAAGAAVCTKDGSEETAGRGRFVPVETAAAVEGFEEEEEEEGGGSMIIESESSKKSVDEKRKDERRRMEEKEGGS